MDILEKRSQEVERAFQEFSRGEKRKAKEMKNVIEEYESLIYSRAKKVEPENNSVNISENEVFLVNPPRKEDLIKDLNRVQQLVALSAAYYSRKKSRSLEKFFSGRQDLQRAAEYLINDWGDTFEGRGGYLPSRDILFIRKLPLEDIRVGSFPDIALPLAKLLLSDQSNRTVEGLLAHELTHMFIERNTGFHDLSGGKFRKASSIDEAAAHIAESLYNSALPPTRAYQAKHNLSKEYMHTAMKVLEKQKTGNSQRSVSKIRKKAINMIEQIEAKGDIKLKEDERSYRKAVKMFEKSERETYPVLKLYGVVNPHQEDVEGMNPEDFNQIIEEFDQKLEIGNFDLNKKLIGTEETDDPQIQNMLQELRKGLLDLTKHARDEEKKELIPLAQELQELLRYIHEEDKEIEQKLNQFYFTRGKTSTEWLKGDTSRERKKDLSKIIAKYRTQILEEAMEIYEDLDDVLNEIFKHEEKLEALEEKLEDEKRYEETLKLIKFTKNIREINEEAGQRLRAANNELKSAEEDLSQDPNIIVA